jgi:DNA polymerase I
MPPILYLLDGHALAYRAYYALTRGTPGSFTTQSGEPTAGIFGFTSILLRILEQEQPDYIAVAFDTGKTFRDEIFPEYKATREKMPDDLQPQIGRIRQLVDAFNIPRLERERYEADDVLGSVARKAVENGLGVKIITGDRDLLQLVDKRIIVNLPGKSLSDAKDYLPQDVVDYMGVRPDQIVDYKALVGDKSDNIPGVAGVGEKTAQSLLQKYETLEEIYEHLDDISENLRKKLEDGMEIAYKSQELARIVTDLDIPLDLEKARPERFDPSVVESLFRELEFRTLLTRLQSLYTYFGKDNFLPDQQLTFLAESKLSIRAPEKAQNGDIKVNIISNSEQLMELTTRLQSAKLISIDTETTSTNQMVAKLVGISLAVDDNEGYYIPVGHSDPQAEQLNLVTVLNTLKDPLTNPNILKVGHNLKYDYVVLARHGLNILPLGFDTMIAEWLRNPESRNLGLKNLAWVRLDIQMTEIVELIGKGKKQRSMADISISEVAPYAVADAVIVLRLLYQLKADLENSNSTKLFEDIEIPLIPVLADMEMHGIGLDKEFLSQLSQSLDERMKEIEKRVYETVGEPFNLNSTQQLSQALFDKLKLNPPDRTQRTSSGYYSTSASVLEGMKGQHPVVDWILEFRELSKLKSTYVDSLPLQVNEKTGRVHTSYNQTGSVTGRIASSDPNLQNIPIRTEMGRMVRKAFIAEHGYQLLSIDYSQVELRIAAHMADDKAMLDAFHADLDIHAATAAAIHNVPIEQVTKDMRRHAKAINFGLLYGMSPYGLTRTTELTLAEAEDFVAAYFIRFPGIKKYLDEMRRNAAEQGFVETLLGRRRYFPGLKTQSNQMIKNREEREAINAPIQGTAADIMKLAMVKVHTALKEIGSPARMLLQVHDELVFEVPEGEVFRTAQMIRKVMENAYQLKIPLRTDARYGLNWDELQSIDPGKTINN